jgi:tellurium resistance protein TerZ
MSISLSKGQKISLSKGGSALTKVEVGLGWAQRKEKYQVKVGGFLGFGGKAETRERSVDVDFDASCILYDDSKNPVDVVYFGQLKSKDGSINHTGDDRGGGGGDNDPNEVISVGLQNIPSNVTSVVFVVNSYTGESFQGVPWAFCNIVDAGSNSEIARYNLNTQGGECKGFVAAKVYRDGGEWKFHAIGESVSGRQKTVRDIEPLARNHA